MRLPSFIIVGGQKCGTTSLHYYLGQHSDVFFPSRKELHFFDSASLKKKSIESYAEYFKSAPEGTICGEATPIYMFYPNALKNIREYLGNIKIIILVRDPVDRAYSQYWHEIKSCCEYLSFEKAIERNEKEDDFFIRHHTYLQRSAYTSQIVEANNIFGEENVGVFRFEKLVCDPLNVTNDVLKFISDRLKPLSNLNIEPKNKAKVHRSKMLNKVFSLINVSARKVIFSKNIIALNLVVSNYPKITKHQYLLAQEKLYRIDPELFKLYSSNKKTS